jgi:hypothetical protein
MKKVSLSLTGLFFLIELSAQQTPTSDCLQNNFCNLTPGPDITTYGSISFFYNILQPLNIPSEIYIDCQAHNGLDTDGPNYQSDYGTGYHTASATTTYIVSRAAIFFQNIIGNYAQERQDQLSTHKVFVECLNSRTKCNLSNNDAGCDKNDNCGNIQ